MDNVLCASCALGDYKMFDPDHPGHRRVAFCLVHHKWMPCEVVRDCPYWCSTHKEARHILENLDEVED